MVKKINLIQIDPGRFFFLHSLATAEAAAATNDNKDKNLKF